MDIQLFGRVVLRYRYLMLGGLLLGAVLAALAYGTPTLGGLKPRGTETWQSTSELLITQQGFPYGRVVPQYTTPDPTAKNPQAVPVGDQTRLASLSAVYAGIANSDAVHAELHGTTKLKGVVRAVAVTDDDGLPEPLVQIMATAATKDGARTLARLSAGILQTHVAAQQTASQIPDDLRVQLELLQNGTKPKLLAGHKKTLPVLVFFAVMVATTALAFSLYNAKMRPRDLVAADGFVDDESLLTRS